MSDVLSFIEHEIVLADGRTVGDGLRNDPWIGLHVLAPILEVDEAGLPRYRLVYLELPRGHWKSGGAAAIATGEAALHPSTDVVIGAVDTDQARVVLENVAGYLQRNPEVGGLFTARRDEFVTRGGSRVRVISSDAPSAFGLGGTHERFRVICDELTAWKTEDLWIALASASGKVKDTQTIVLSNAGFDAERSWQWEIRQTADEAEWAYLFSADGVIASWITPEWVAQMQALLPAAAFERLIGNLWTTGAGDFVSVEQWRSCVDHELSPGRGGSGRRFAGLDLGLTHDRTVLAVVHWDEDRIVLDELLVWQGSRAEPVSIAAVEAALVDASERWPSFEVYADPWQLKGSMERLRGRVRIQEWGFSQSSVRKLSVTLFNAITSATLRAYPDAELEREITGLRVVEAASGWRFDHRTGAFSDRAVALAMAILLAEERGRSRLGWTQWVDRGEIPGVADVELGANVVGW
jgi:hypothetical protein